MWPSVNLCGWRFFAWTRDGTGSAMSRRHMRFAAVALGALMLALAAVPRPALAEGTLAIEPTDGVARDYGAWRVLSGKVTGKGDDLRLSDVEFTKAFTRDEWRSLGADADTAQDVADWIAANTSDQLANRVDWAVEDSGVAADRASIKADGTPVTLDDGYWLVSSADSSPVLVLVGGGAARTVTEKAEAPTVQKYVRTTGEWSQFAVASVGDTIHYKIVGTVPHNYDSFPTYAYSFDDASDPSIGIDASSVRVRLGGEDGRDVTSLATVTSANARLSVSFADLKKALPQRGDVHTVTVTYDAKLLPSATSGLADTNDNTATLSYPRKPARTHAAVATPPQASMHATRLLLRTPLRLRVPSRAAVTTATATTAGSQCRVATWSVRIHKVDSATGKALSGAGFTVRDSQGLYVNTDGSRTAEKDKASVWKTSSDGSVTIPGTGDGSYTLTEVVAPKGYNTADAATVTLKGADAQAKGFSAQATKAKVEDVDPASGVARVNIADVAKPAARNVPNTGLGRLAGGISKMLPKTGDPVSIAGAVLLVCGGAAAIWTAWRVRRKNDEA